jgi:membrane-bound metal-dependent hydrolase YbcI (DUF457 family)
MAAGWLAEPTKGGGLPGRRSTLAFAILGIAADLDLLAGAHRGPTHSMAAALLVGVAAWLVVRGRNARAVRIATACALAYGSHVLLDWLGTDTSPPVGVPALWPISSAYFEAPWHIFDPISRRFSQPALFWMPNVVAVTRELLILVPIVALVWLARTRAHPSDR